MPDPSMSQSERPMPERVGLCPEHRDEFWYPLADGEGLQCPCCERQMIVYVPSKLTPPEPPVGASGQHTPRGQSDA